MDEKFIIEKGGYARLTIQEKINYLKYKLTQYDYIGVKIATGRATKEQYATQIAQMAAWADEIDRLERELNGTI